MPAGGPEPPPGTTRGARLKEAARRNRERAERASSWARTRVPGAEIALEAFERDRLAAAGLLAGGVAFRLFLWLAPFGLVLAAILGFWVEANPQGLEDAVREFGIGAVAARSATDAIAEEAHSRWYFLVVGLALLAWSSMGAVRALRLAHFVAWGIPPTKVRRPLAAGALFTIVTTGVLSASAATSWLRDELGLAGLLGLLAIFVLYAAAALVLLLRLPHADAPWKALLPGAALLALGSWGIHVFVVVYLVPKLGRSTELYGSLGAATVILFWLYLTARLIVASAFLNASLWDRKGDDHDGVEGPARANRVPHAKESSPGSPPTAVSAEEG